MNEARCPHCNALLIEDDCYNSDIDDNNVRTYIVGHCDNCEKEFQWEKLYEFKKVESLSEIY